MIRYVYMLFVSLVVSSCSVPIGTSTGAQPAINGDPGNCYPDPETGVCVCSDSPVIVSLGDNVISLSGYENGVRFELRPGRNWLWAWPEQGSDDAWLALPGTNGIVDDGTELFGNNTLQPTSGDPNGFRALSTYDTAAFGGDGDGKITADDAVFAQLRLWRDVVRDGVSDPAELIPLSRAGITELSLSFEVSNLVDEHGNQFRYSSTIVAESPVSTTVYDVWLVGSAFSYADPGDAQTNTETTSSYVCIYSCHSVMLNQQFGTVNDPTNACAAGGTLTARSPSSLGATAKVKGEAVAPQMTEADSQARLNCALAAANPSSTGAACARWIAGGFTNANPNGQLGSACQAVIFSPPPTGDNCVPL